MNEQTMLMLARKRQQNLCAEACRLRGVPRRGKGFGVELLGKRPLARARAQPTLAAGAGCVEAECCVA